MTSILFVIVSALISIALVHTHILPNAWLTPDTMSALLLLSIVPLAGNCVVVATELGAKP